MSLLTTLALVAADPAPDNPVADFSDTPWWISLIKGLFIFVYLMLSVVVMLWFERRVLGKMQWRPGPNRFGPLGLLQTIADGVKLITMEEIEPKKADKLMFFLAPVLSMTMACVSFAVIPMGGDVTMFGHRTPLQLADGPIAVLMVLAVAGVGAYGVVLAGWSSGSPYPLIGGLRATAQIVSYEIAMGLALVAVFLTAGSMSTSRIVDQQNRPLSGVPVLEWIPSWFILPAFFSFVVYLVTMFAETNRIPFDLAEGESELVNGYMTEYSSMKFGMFYLGEYINMFTISALAATMFLGGWHAPWGAVSDVMDTGYWGILWLTVKMWFFMWVFVWVRGSVPRVRYDQLMKLGWKVLIPLTLAWVVAVAFIRGARDGMFMADTRTALLIVVAVICAIVLSVAWVFDSRRGKQQEAEQAALAVPDEVDPFAGGYPVPPMPGQRLREPARPARTERPAGTQTVDSTATATLVAEREAIEHGDESPEPLASKTTPDTDSEEHRG